MFSSRTKAPLALAAGSVSGCNAQCQRNFLRSFPPAEAACICHYTHNLREALLTGTQT